MGFMGRMRDDDEAWEMPQASGQSERAGHGACPFPAEIAKETLLNGVAADLLRVRVSSVTLETHHTMTEGHSHDGFPHTVWNLVHAVGADSAAGEAGAREAFCRPIGFQSTRICAEPAMGRTTRRI